MAYNRFERRQDEAESTDKYFFNLALRGNAIVQEVAFRMIDEADAIEDTFPEYKRGTIRGSKVQNAAFMSFRKDFRTVISLTEAHILKNKHTGDDEALIRECLGILGKPYGSYDLREITTLSHRYFNLLIRKGIIAIVSGWEDTTTESRMRKF